MGIRNWLNSRLREPPSGVCPDAVIADAEKRRREAYARWPIVNDAAARLDEQRQRNHFGEVLDATFQSRRA